MDRFSSALVLAGLPCITCCFPVSTSIRLQFHALSELNVEGIDLRFTQEKKLLKLYISICEEMAWQLKTSQGFSYKIVKSLKQFNPRLVLVLFYISNYLIPFAKSSINRNFGKMKKQ